MSQTNSPGARQTFSQSLFSTLRSIVLDSYPKASASQSNGLGSCSNSSTGTNHTPSAASSTKEPGKETYDANSVQSTGSSSNKQETETNYTNLRDRVHKNSQSADSIAREGNIQKSAHSILHTLIRQEVDSLYILPKHMEKQIDETIQCYSMTCIEAQGVDKAVCKENIKNFLDAIENVFGDDMDMQFELSAQEYAKQCFDGEIFSSSAESFMSSTQASDSPDRVSTKKVLAWKKGGSESAPQSAQPGQNSKITAHSMTASMSSIHSSDTPVTVSTKKVLAWKKGVRNSTPAPLLPGVLWHRTQINPENAQKQGLGIIHEHVLEDHIMSAETALDEREVQLVNEMRSLKGEEPIMENSAVVVNNCVYVTGRPAVFACVMETYDDQKRVNIFVHKNLSTSKYAASETHNYKTLIVECAKTGACMMKRPVHAMRFWKELGTATICMLPAEGPKLHMAPTVYFHLESVSHCRLFAKQLTRK